MTLQLFNKQGSGVPMLFRKLNKQTMMFKKHGHHHGRQHFHHGEQQQEHRSDLEKYHKGKDEQKNMFL